MKLGKIGITHAYVVDLENADMVADARASIYEDMMNAVKYNELENCIGVIKDNTQISEEDIPEFLKDEEMNRVLDGKE